jgi:uncharacterized protein YdeI (YjbR/CyaY-like superfamily)
VVGEEAIFFETPGALRAWLQEHYAAASELWVGYYKKGSDRRSLTWSDVVDEALCVGWIDGKAQRIDEHRYKQRLSPRRAEQQLERSQRRQGRRATGAGAHDSGGRGGIRRAP